MYIYKEFWKNLQSHIEYLIEEEMMQEEARRLQTLAAEVDTAAKNGDIARLKEVQQLDTSGNTVIIIIIT